MADLKITQLPSASLVTGSDVLPIVRGGVTDQITVNNFGQSIFNLGLPVTASTISQTDYIDFNTGSATPTWKSGRVFWDNTDGCLAVYNNEADVTLQVGQENWTRVRNNTGTTITNGTAVRLLGSQGDVPTVERAQSVAISGSVNDDNQILGLATHDIENNSFGYITTQGLVRGLNTNAFNDGDTLFVGTGSSGVLQNVPPRAPFEIIPIGVCVKASPGGSGIIYVAVQQPYDFGDLSSVLVTGSYDYGDLWVYKPSGSLGVWSHQKQLSGSYAVTGSWSATSFTGSLLGTASYATNHAVITSSYVCDGILNANQTFTTGSDATIAFVDYVDPNNWLASNQFKPTIAGYYSVSFGVWLQNPGVATNQTNTQMRKNGNSIIISQQPLNNGTGISLGGSRIVQMNGTTDYLDWTIFQGTAGSGTTGTILQGSANGQGTWFSAFLLTQ